MKGLIIKDLKLVLSNKNIFLFLPVIISMSVFSKSQLAVYVFAYVSVVVINLVTTTISYDDFENSTSFLMTLPVSRKDYVRSKYILGLVSLFCGTAVSIAVAAVIDILKRGSVDFYGLALVISVLLLAMIFLLSLVIPIQLKFGPSHGKIVLTGIIIICMMVLAAIIIVMRNHSNEILSFFVTEILENSVMTAVSAAAALIIILALSYIISDRIMKKREL